MAKADGTIIIDTKINSEGAEAGTKELEAAARRMANSLNDLGEKARIALQKQVDSFAKLNNQYAEQAKKVDELKKKVAEYENQKVPTQEYSEIQTQIDSAQKKLDSLIQRQQKFIELGGKTSSQTYKSMQYDIDELTNTIKYANSELDELQKAGKAFTFGANTEAAQKDIASLAKEEAKLADMNNRLRTSYQSLEQKVNDYKKGITKADKATGKMNKTSRGAGMSLGKMLATSVLFSFVFQAISAVMNGVTEGMGNLAQYSNETNATLSMLMSSLTQLKNAFATAFSPILTAIAPALNYLINLLTAATTAMAQLISALTGKRTFVKATKVQQDYATSLEGTAGAAKEAEGALASFDKLNVMPDTNSGGGGAGELSPSEMFETVPIDNSLTRAIDAAKAKLNELAGIFKSGFFDGVGDLSVIDSIKESIASIKQSLYDIFSDPDVISAFENMVNTLVYDAGRISGAFVSVGLTIADNILGGFEKFLKQNKQKIKNYLISMFDITSQTSTIAADFAVAAADIFSVFRSDAAKQLTADIINIFATSFMSVTELAGKLGRDILNVILTPITENSDGFKEALSNTIEPIQSMISTLAGGISETFGNISNMYDEHLKPMFDSFKDGVSEIVESLLNGYNTYIAPVLDLAAQKFSELWKNIIQPLLNNAIGLIGDVADLIKTVWENILQPVINWIAQNIMPAIAPVLEALVIDFSNVFSQIGEIIDGFITSIRGVVEFLTGVFSGDWERAWEGIKKIFKGIWDAMPDFVKEPIRSVIGFINKMIEAVESGINSVVQAANGLSFTVPDWVPGIGGDRFGFDLSPAQLPRIPQLASGTVIPPRAGEFAAILGDNKKETEVVSPLSTMKQALKEALIESGSMSFGDIIGYVYLDGKEMGQSTVKFVRQEKKRTGKNPVLV